MNPGVIGAQSRTVGIHVSQQDITGRHERHPPPGRANPAFVGSVHSESLAGPDVAAGSVRGLPSGTEQQGRRSSIGQLLMSGGRVGQISQMARPGRRHRQQFVAAQAQLAGAVCGQREVLVVAGDHAEGGLAPGLQRGEMSASFDGQMRFQRRGRKQGTRPLTFDRVRFPGPDQRSHSRQVRGAANLLQLAIIGRPLTIPVGEQQNDLLLHARKNPLCE